jgi:hypothetical protein
MSHLFLSRILKMETPGQGTRVDSSNSGDGGGSSQVVGHPAGGLLPMHAPVVVVTTMAARRKGASLQPVPPPRSSRVWSYVSLAATHARTHASALGAVGRWACCRSR